MNLFQGNSTKLKSVAPVFGTVDLDRWCSHYEALGFHTEKYGRDYGIASNNAIEVHVSVNSDHDPAKTAGCAFMHVSDADAVWEHWSTVESGKNIAPVDTDYGLREGAHVDPDNNLLRYASPI